LRNLSGRAVVIVTHEPEAAGIADRVLQLREGRLVAESDKLASRAGDQPASRAIRGSRS
jgi:ABC-type lipoprotein export system ATPase subunit